MLIQFSKYMTIGTVSIIIGMIIALIGLWIYSEWLIYQQKYVYFILISIYR